MISGGKEALLSSSCKAGLLRASWRADPKLYSPIPQRKRETRQNDGGKNFRKHDKIKIGAAESIAAHPFVIRWIKGIGGIRPGAVTGAYCL